MLQGQSRADVAGHDAAWVLGQILRRGGFHRDLTGDSQQGSDSAAAALEVHLPVTGHADDDHLALTVRADHCDDDVLQGVGCAPRVVVLRELGVGRCDQGLDGVGVRGVGPDFGGRQVLVLARFRATEVTASTLAR